MVHAQSLSPADTKRMLVGCFSDLAAHWRPSFKAVGDDPAWEREQHITAGQECVDELLDQIDRGEFDQGVYGTANALLQAEGRSLGDLPSGQQSAFLEGVARAKIEAHRYVMFRLTDRLSAYQVQDPALKKPFPWMEPLPPAISPAGSHVSHVVDVGPTLDTMVERYLAAMKPAWVPKTYVGVRSRLRQFADCVGGSKPIAAISSDDVLAYRDGVMRLSKDHQVLGGSFLQRQTSDVDGRIAHATVKDTVAGISTFFAWAVKERKIAENPATKIFIPKAKSIKGQKPRLPFSQADLETLFTAPLYTGCASRARPHDQGAEIISCGHYWLPILGYYTGARAGELIQLAFADVALDGEIPHLNINEDGGGPLGSSDHKHLKTKAAVRLIPLHPDLIELGFGDFVRRVSKARGGKGRLFHDISYGADQVSSSAFSKWFGRVLRRRGLTSPKLVFHSFRHNMKDALRNASLPPYVIDRFLGHVMAGEDYGDGNELQLAYEAIKSAKLKVDLPSLLAGHRPAKI